MDGKRVFVATVGAAIFPDSDYYDFLVYRSESLGKLDGIFNQNCIVRCLQEACSRSLVSALWNTFAIAMIAATVSTLLGSIAAIGISTCDHGPAR